MNIISILIFHKLQAKFKFQMLLLLIPRYYYKNTIFLLFPIF